MAPPGAMKWVPVSKADADAEEPKKEASVAKKPHSKAEAAPRARGEDFNGSSSGKGKNGSSSGGKSAKGSSGQGTGKSEAKGHGKGDGRGGGKGDSGKAAKGWDSWEAWDYRPQQEQHQQQSYQQQQPSRGGGGAGRSGGKGGAKGDGGKAGGKDGGKGSGKKGGGKSAGKGGAREDHGGAVKTVQEVEAEMANNQVSSKAPMRVKRGPDSYTKQPIDAKGSHCEVRKHSGMGCAVVSTESFAARESIMVYVEKKFGGNRDTPPKMEISDVTVQMRRHTDKSTQREVVTDIFVAWGHRQEKESPLACDDIAEAFDNLFKEASGAQGAVPAGVMHQYATAPQQQLGVMGGAGARQPAGGPPPPPSHMPSVGAPGAPLPAAAGQGTQAAYYDAYQRQVAAAYGHQYAGYAQQQQPRYPGYPPQQQQPYHPYYQQQAAYHQQAQAAAMHHQLRQMQHMQYLQQQQQLQAQQQQPPTPSHQMPQPQAQQPLAPQAMPGTPVAAAAPPPAGAAPAVPPSPAAAGAAAAPPLQAPPAGGAEAAAPEAAPMTPMRSAAGSSDFAPAKPRIVPIVDPSTGKPVDTVGMNFEPRKPSTPIAIKNPQTGQQVTP